MTFTRIRLRGLLVATAALVALSVAAANATTISILNNDGAGEGFNDPAARAPVGGNTAMTLGGQRLFVFNHAASIWASILQSPVPIIVQAQFNPQTCTPTSAVLGSAGPVTVHRDFLNAPFPGTWYHQALANSLAGMDLAAANPDINATFNLNLDSGSCLGGLVWYYGLDGNEGANIDLLPVVLHELGHGLGFSTTTSGSTGSFNGGFPHIYDRFLMDNMLGLHWFQMTAGQRAASAISVNHLVWDGPATFPAAGAFLAHRPQLVINSPGGIAGTYTVQPAAFGPSLTQGGITGNVVLVDDTVPPESDACEGVANVVEVQGNIAFIDRGTCTFVSKVLAAQQAGATAVIIANNVSAGLPPMGGTDPTVTIPSVGISQADGNTIRANLMAGVNVTLNLHATFLAGADDTGKPMMYAPNPFQGGSSVSHFDVLLTPNALMEPAINADLPAGGVDLTRFVLQDIGWSIIATDAATSPAVTRIHTNYPNPFNPSTTILFSLEAQGPVRLEVYDVAGHLVKQLADGPMSAGPHTLRWDGTDIAGRPVATGVYVAKLEAVGRSDSKRLVLVK